MALAFDSSAKGGASSTSLTFAHTCSGTDRLLIVGVTLNIAGGTDTVTGVTYGGVAMTRIDTQANTNERVYLYSLINPSTGSNNVVISSSASTNIRGVSASYTGADQTAQPNASAKNSTTGATSLAASPTVTRAGCWLVGAIGNNGAQDMSISSGSERQSEANIASIGDSNGAVGTGSQTQTWTFGSQRAHMVVAAIQPPEVSASSNPMFFSTGGNTLG